ncbi:MAG: RimJ/RimL family protein N-acetyltransferase [Crocinitomicaceae bacterium]|jgi:RimJ/RimL family protein N-acetyltransferase
MFSTNRLHVRPLQYSDSDNFFDMMSNPNVMNPIPQEVKTREESDANLQKLIQDPKEKTVWAVCEKDDNELIGLCALLVNDEGQDEIGYRLREQYWRQGYGTEITAGLIDYCFQELNFSLLTADVNIENIPSVKILEKFMKPVREFYNENDQCTDRRYKVMNR